jgi:hypothetical protein
LVVGVVGLVIILGTCPPVTGPNDPITGPDDSAPQSEYLGMVLAASGGFGTGASASVAARAIAGSVTELNIGSADIFAFSYDETNGRWDSPAGISGTGNTYENDPRAVLITNGLSFTPGGSDLTDSLAIENMPDLVEVIYINNVWHNVTVDGSQYGDHNRNDAYLERTNRLSTGEAFTGFDIVFVSDAIISQNFLVRNNGGLEIVSSGIADEAEVLAAVQKIDDEVRRIGEYALFIPMTAFAFHPALVSVEITVDLTTLIEDVTATDVIYSLDEDGSPISYSISIDDAATDVDYDDDGTDDSPGDTGTQTRISEFNIGSADIFSFSYDSANDRWDSPAGISGTGNTYENDVEALLITDGLGFTADLENVASLVNTQNFPSTIDILYFDNSWHNVTVDGVQYGDHDRNGARESRINRLPDGTSFTQFDIVYVNRAIVPVGCLVRRSGGALVMETDNVANESAVLGAIEKISSEVRYIEQYALFIPIDPVAYDESTTIIVIGVRTDNLISEVDDSSVTYALDENRSPLTYVISVRNE